VYDLRSDPGPLIELDEEDVRRRIFTPQRDLPEGVERIPLKEIHINKCPVVVPMNTLSDTAADRWGIDMAIAHRHLERLRQAALGRKIQAIYKGREFASVSDPDQALYGGGFFSDADKRKIDIVQASTPDELAALDISFGDKRLPEMLFRYRARNWPNRLSEQERQRWERFRINRLTNPDADSGITLGEYRSSLAKMMVDPGLGERARGILSELADWPGMIGL